MRIVAAGHAQLTEITGRDHVRPAPRRVRSGAGKASRLDNVDAVLAESNRLTASETLVAARTSTT